MSFIKLDYHAFYSNVKHIYMVGTWSGDGDNGGLYSTENGYMDDNHKCGSLILSSRR